LRAERLSHQRRRIGIVKRRAETVNQLQRLRQLVLSDPDTLQRLSNLRALRCRRRTTREQVERVKSQDRNTVHDAAENLVLLCVFTPADRLGSQPAQRGSLTVLQ